MLDALIAFLKTATAFDVALLVVAYVAILIVAFVVALAVLLPIAWLYCWIKNPHLRTRAWEARNREMQAQLDARLAGARRRAFLRRRAERAAKRAREAARVNPWLPA